MAVPGGDQRDFEFAQKFGLPVIRTVQPPADFDGQSAWTGDGTVINSGFLNGKSVEQAKAAMIDWLERERKGAAAHQLQAARLAVLAAALLGRAVPDRVRRRQAADGARRRAARGPAGARRVQAERLARRAAGGGRRLARDRRRGHGQEGAPRDEHDAAVGRLVLVLPAVRGPDERRAAHRSRSSRSTGCPSTFTSAAPSTPCCTFYMRASGTRRSTTPASSPRRSRS